MTLNKRLKRDIRHSISLYTATVFLTILSLLLFYLYDICGTGIMNFTNDFFITQKVEDASFTTYKEIPDDKIPEYENKYDLVLEKQNYVNIDTNGVTSRVFKKTHKVDLYKVIDGNDVKTDSDIVISKGFAVEKNVKIGDKLKVKDKDYTVTGYMERPDYLYMLENMNDSYKNVTTFYLCYMTDKEFDSLGDTTCQYLVRYNDENRNTEFRKDINAEYILSSYTAAKNNFRISMTNEQPKVFIQMAYLILFTLPLMAVLFISIILSRKIKSEQKMIGTLTAYGYKKSQIITHYAFFSAIPGVIGGILTTIIVALCAQPYGELGLMDYEPMPVEFKLSALEMALGIIVPTLMYILSTVFTVRKLLKNDITALLSGSVQSKSKTKKFLVKKDISFRTKFSIRSIFGNPGRAFALFLGVFLGCFVIFLSFADMDSIKNIKDENTKTMENYSYKYVLNTLEKNNKFGGETLLVSALEDDKENIISIYGADGNSLLGLKDENEKAIEITDGYCVTSLYAEVAGLKVGDEITLQNPLSTGKFKIKITEITPNNFEKALYTTRENVSEISNIDKDYFNMILSEDKLDIPDKDVCAVINRETIGERFEAAFSQMEAMLTAFIIVGILLCVVSIYLAVKITVNENQSNISMLRILGYEDKRINKLLIRDNIFIVLLAIAISIPTTSAALSALFRSFVPILGYLVEICATPKSYILSIALVLLSYVLSMLLIKRKIAKVDMVEALKDNRE